MPAAFAIAEGNVEDGGKQAEVKEVGEEGFALEGVPEGLKALQPIFENGPKHLISSDSELRAASSPDPRLSSRTIRRNAARGTISSSTARRMNFERVSGPRASIPVASASLAARISWSRRAMRSSKICCLLSKW